MLDCIELELNFLIDTLENVSVEYDCIVNLNNQ